MYKLDKITGNLMQMAFNNVENHVNVFSTPLANVLVPTFVNGLPTLPVDSVAATPVNVFATTSMPLKASGSKRLSSEATTTPTARPKTKRPKKAVTWKYFVEIPNTTSVMCSLCGTQIKAKNSSTTGMIRHLKSRHPAENRIIEQNSAKTLLDSINAISDEEQKPGFHATPSTSNLVASRSTVPQSIDDLNAALAKVIVSDVMDVSVLDNPLFRGFLERNAPSMKLYSADEFSKIVIPAIKLKE